MDLENVLIKLKFNANYQLNKELHAPIHQPKQQIINVPDLII